MRIHWKPLYMVTIDGKPIASGLPRSNAVELKKRTLLSVNTLVRVSLDKEANKPPSPLSDNVLNDLYRKYKIFSLVKYLGISTNTIYRRLKKAGYITNQAHKPKNTKRGEQ